MSVYEAKTFEEILLENRKGREALCGMVKKHLGREKYSLLVGHLEADTKYGFAYAKYVCTVHGIGTVAEAALQLEFAGHVEVEGAYIAGTRRKPHHTYCHLRPQAG